VAPPLPAAEASAPTSPPQPLVIRQRAAAATPRVARPWRSRVPRDAALGAGLQPAWIRAVLVTPSDSRRAALLRSMMPPRTILRPLSRAAASVTSRPAPSLLDAMCELARTPFARHPRRQNCRAIASFRDQILLFSSTLAVGQQACGSHEELQRCFAVPPGLNHARSDGAVPREPEHAGVQLGGELITGVPLRMRDLVGIHVDVGPGCPGQEGDH
jgi:hypothetical protein